MSRLDKENQRLNNIIIGIEEYIRECYGECEKAKELTDIEKLKMIQEIKQSVLWEIQYKIWELKQRK